MGRLQATHDGITVTTRFKRAVRVPPLKVWMSAEGLEDGVCVLSSCAQPSPLSSRLSNDSC